ncbi:protein kinase [Fusibacter bizertensis]|uniref:non-specific serine/threonine protein kinase n=1 Tax=Fusibacter bizertensis TaxID=1488331 RepID=A0ABT6NAE0_9FIRM|nr:protein kinase [Fusibacter bizertensis]MDH8677365.1 protein kinase [Fusibacter bizertensis]
MERFKGFIMTDALWIQIIQMLSIFIVIPVIIPQILPNQNKKQFWDLFKIILMITLLLVPIVLVYPAVRIVYMVVILFIAGHKWFNFNLNQSLWFAFSILGVFLIAEVVSTTLVMPIFTNSFRLSQSSIAFNFISMIAIVILVALGCPFLAKPIKRLLSDRVYLKKYQITMTIVFVTMMAMMILFVTLITNDVFQYTANPIVVFLFYILLIGGALISIYFVDKYYKSIYEINQYKSRLSSIKPELEKSSQFLHSVEFDISNATFRNNSFENNYLEKMLYNGRNSQIYLLKNMDSKEKLTLKAIEKSQGIKYDFTNLTSLTYDHLSPVLDWGEGENYYYVIKPFVNGTDAQTIVEQNGPFSAHEVKHIILCVARVLDYMHSQIEPIIYRDVKPSNIILGADQEVTLIDIESVRTVNEDKTSDTFIIGTKGYASPEQYGFSQSSPLSDVYGIGATAFFLLTGRMPDIKEAERIKWDLTEKDNFDLNQLTTMIQKCMKFAPEQRYQNIKEIISLLTSS